MSERSRQQTKMISFRVLTEAYEQLKREAEEANVTISALIKLRVFGKAAYAMKTIAPSPPKDLSLLREILGHLGKIGSNLNQIARHLNQNGNLEDQQILKELLKEIRIMRNALLNALGVTWDRKE